MKQHFPVTCSVDGWIGVEEIKVISCSSSFDPPADSVKEEVFMTLILQNCGHVLSTRNDCPGQMAHLVGASSCTPRGFGLGS